MGSKITIWLILFAGFIAGGVYFLLDEAYILGVLLCVLGFLCGVNIVFIPKKNLRKISLVFDAIDNDDYSFRLKDSKHLTDENDMLNHSLNRINKLVLSARKKARESEKHFEIILNQINTGILVINDLGIVTRVNSYALNLLSCSQLNHINQLERLNPKAPNMILDLEDGKSCQINYFNESSKVNLSLSATVLELQKKQLKVITITDIFSDIDHAEIDSWSKMSRVFTHEIMNSLAPITAISESLSNSTDLEYINKGIKIIQSTSTRLLGFVESYRSLTRLPAPKLEELYLKELVSKCCGLIGAGERVKVNIAEGEHLVMADRDQISQVLVNLLKNAVEAVDDADGGEVWINLSYDSNGQSTIEVCNSGKLISDEMRENIFIPFFTTKTDGTGIGLSLSRQIMRQHQGSLVLSTHPHTCFRVNFP